MAICDHCRAEKLSESPCAKCGESGNLEDMEALPAWYRRKIRAARKKRIARDLTPAAISCSDATAVEAARKDKENNL